jgi:hypothetical protein
LEIAKDAIPTNALILQKESTACTKRLPLYTYPLERKGKVFSVASLLFLQDVEGIDVRGRKRGSLNSFFVEEKGE